MVQLKIVQTCSSCFFACCQHAKIVITDFEANQQFLVSFYGNKSHPIRPIQDEERYESAGCCESINTLYSDKSLVEFVKLYKKEFDSSSFFLYANNCSDAALYALNYFCPLPNEEKQQEKCSLIQCASTACEYGKDALCCVLLTVTCSLDCFDVSCISTPSKVMAEAKRRAKWYGKNTEKSSLLPPAKSPVEQKM